MDKTNITKDKTAKTLTLERVFDAPRERVWRAWTTDEINNWWGPRGWETTSKHMDVTPGGYWLYGMKCVDENQSEFFGQESWGKMIYDEIDEPSKIIYTDYFSDESGAVNEGMPSSTTTLEFIEEDGKTRVVSKTVFESEADFDTVIGMGIEQGIAETWDRLAEHVGKKGA
jgi:uncharacterized protein YndB with AHSA1/START domain